MEGYTLLRRVREFLGEPVGGSFMNDRTSYDCLYDAVKDFNKKTHFQTGTQVIPVGANVSDYNLNPDFVGMALRDRYNKPFIKYTVNGTDYFLNPMDYQDMILANDTSSSSVPSGYSIIDAPQVAQIAGAVTADGAITASTGECTLTDSGADFSNVAAGDFVHNLTDGSHGVVLAKIGGTSLSLLCALFEGTTNAWTSGDDYMIVPQARYQIIFTPTPSAVATATITYIVRPDPVYSPFRAYKIPSDAELPICQFAAYLYKYRDREPNIADALYKHYELFTSKAVKELNRGRSKPGFSVNLSKSNRRSTGSGGWR